MNQFTDYPPTAADLQVMRQRLEMAYDPSRVVYRTPVVGRHYFIEEGDVLMGLGTLWVITAVEQHGYRADWLYGDDPGPFHKTTAVINVRRIVHYRQTGFYVVPIQERAPQSPSSASAPHRHSGAT